MKVPFHRPSITEEEIAAVAVQLRNGWLTMGRTTYQFEDDFKASIGCSHAVAVNSATAALHLAMIAADIGPGDEVILPAVTFAATAEVVRYRGAVPIIADVERDTGLMDASSLDRLVTTRTRAVIPVHYAGQPCDMDAILSLARDRGLYVIEDAAHSLPAAYHGRPVGTLGDATCFSFYATKTMTTGEGGMITTARDEWAARMRRLRLHGISRDAWQRHVSPNTWEYDIVDLGYKYNLTDVAAALGIGQLGRIDAMRDARESIAGRYDAAFAGRDDVTPLALREGRVTARYLYPVLLNPDVLDISRDEFVRVMRDAGIELSVHFIPLYRFSYYRELGYDGRSCPNAEWLFPRIVSLPIFPDMTDDESTYVIERALSCLDARRR